MNVKPFVSVFIVVVAVVVGRAVGGIVFATVNESPDQLSVCTESFQITLRYSLPGLSLKWPSFVRTLLLTWFLMQSWALVCRDWYYFFAKSEGK
jgi:hypothetical protein